MVEWRNVEWWNSGVPEWWNMGVLELLYPHEGSGLRWKCKVWSDGVAEWSGGVVELRSDEVVDW